MIQVTVQEAQQRLPELLTAAQAGESVVIKADAGRSFQLTVQAVTGTKEVMHPSWPGYPKAGSCKGMIWLSEDFDAPLEELREYME
jgi:hypothetical protein